MTTIEAMTKYGGGFVRALAECWRRADRQNQVKLYMAFQELFREYEHIAIRKTPLTETVAKTVNEKQDQ